jgi:SanA protein
MRTKWIRLLMTFILLGFMGILAIFTIDYRVQQVGDRYMVSAEDAPHADAILVLGALVRPDGAPSPILNDRLKVALGLYNMDKSDKVLLSGDHGQIEYDEVNAMKSFMEQNEVDEQNIFMDHAGFSTYESLYRARDVFKVKKVVIVTQEYHLKRAIYTARKMGLEAYGVAADLQNYRGMSKFKLREIAARNKDFVLVNILKSKPTYLGDEIPITGDGRLTHDE